MQKPGLVASDVDGTLLDPWERVSDRTARVVHRLAREVPFVLVTGRPPRWIPPVVDGLGLAGIAVCANGAAIYDAAADRVLHSIEIDPVRLRDVARELRHALPGCVFGVERTTGSAWARPDEQFVAEEGFRQVWPNQDIHVAAPDELLGKPAVKLLVLHEKMTSEEMALVVEETRSADLQLTFSTGAGLIELSAPGVDKASGLAMVAAERGVAAEDTIAFGDMPNDIPMLDWAGHGVAMRNAHSGVLAVANEVTAANRDDGVAQVLERWWP